jgi:hypothetical protein
MSAGIVSRIPDAVGELTVSRHVMQRAKERGIDESILSAALDSVGQQTDVVEQAGGEVLLEFEDTLTDSTYCFPLAFEEDEAVLQTAYIED